MTLHPRTARAREEISRSPARTPDALRRGTTSSTLVSPLVIALGLYVAALFVRLVAIAGADYPINEGSAYYLAVARNLVEGRGLVTDALWSLATPPLEVPRPAFELWQPMASFISAVPMALLGPSVQAGQLGHVLFGALIAPLCWFIARDAARSLGVPAGRAATLSIGAGLVAAFAGPFVVAAAIPDSTTPFLILGVTSCLLMPRALEGGARIGLLLGVCLGLTYLARLEAIYIAFTFLLLAAPRWRLMPPIIAGGLLVTVPWLLRNLAAFGTLFPGQAIENLFFVRNEDVFAFTQRPTLAGFLAQGPETIVGNVANAFRHNLVDVLLLPAAPIVAVGGLAVIWLAREPRVRATALWPLLLSGFVTLVVISVLFPVATLWGTFQHASGPLLAGLLASAALGADALVARLRQLRGWPRSNAWLAPAALLGLTVPLALLLAAPAAGVAASLQQRHSMVASAVAGQPDVPSTLISDRPVWLAEATGIPAVILPDEALTHVVRLARDLGAPMVVVVEARGRYPNEFRTPEGRACFDERLLGDGAASDSAIFVIREDCRQ